MSENEQKDDAFLDEDFNEDFGELKGDGSQKKKRMMMLLFILLLAGGAFFFLTSEEDSGFDDFSLDDTALITPRKIDHKKKPHMAKMERAERKEKRSKKSKRTEATATNTIPAAIVGQSSQAQPQAQAPQKTAAFGALTVLTPAEGASRYYDLSSDRPVFSWEGNSESIIFSRNPNMKPVHYKMKTKGQSHTGKHLEPGTWYWQVKNSSGKSEPRSYSIISHNDLVPNVLEPTNGSTIFQDGSVVKWSLLSRAAYYRVQITEKDTWLSPSYMFATSGSELTMAGVAPGSYKLRVGGFSEISGRWEYSEPISVDVQ